jgi:hypothetical protein
MQFKEIKEKYNFYMFGISLKISNDYFPKQH